MYLYVYSARYLFERASRKFDSNSIVNTITLVWKSDCRTVRVYVCTGLFLANRISAPRFVLYSYDRKKKKNVVTSDAKGSAGREGKNNYKQNDPPPTPVRVCVRRE